MLRPHVSSPTPSSAAKPLFTAQTGAKAPIGIDGGWLSTWALPPDPVAATTLALSALLLVAALSRAGVRRLTRLLEVTAVGETNRQRRFLAFASFSAAFLSLGYIAFYLRGGPRATDAPAYFLQGRALSHGHFTWTSVEPLASFHAANLLFRMPGALAGIFPPGFPCLLAGGFLVGAPMVVGPALAAGIVWATWWAARELAAGTGASPGRTEATGRVAAGLSIACAALRYHTADTLPFGAAALATAVIFAAALRGRRTSDPRSFAVSGAALGTLVAVQPLSAVGVGAVAVVLAWQSRRRPACLGAFAAALPGLLLLAAANHAAVGRFAASPTAVYAALVHARTISGASAMAAIARTMQRVRAHMLDVANFEPIALLPIVVFVGKRRVSGASWAVLAIAVQLLVFAPVTTAGPSPAAGCSVLASVLPLDHTLVALSIARLFPRAMARATAALLSLSLCGFAVHASFSHRRLATGGIGRPPYEPDVTREAGVAAGLLFFEDDTGYELALDPFVTASHGVEAARLRGDDHDRLLYDLLGHPPAHRYVTSTTGPSSVVPWSAPAAGELWRFEAESEWPPCAGAGGHVEVDTAAPPCASNGRALTVTPNERVAATATLELPLPADVANHEPRGWTVMPRIVQRGTGATGSLSIVDAPGGAPLAQWTWKDDARVASCIDLPPRPIEIPADHVHAFLVVEGRGGAVTLDRTTLRRAPQK